MDDRNLCWLALHLVFHGPSTAARRVLGRFPSVLDVFRAKAADFEGLRLENGTIEAIVSGRAIGRAGEEVEKIVKEFVNEADELGEAKKADLMKI